MINFKIRKDVKLKDGTSSVRLQICHNNKVKYINLKISGNIDSWNPNLQRFDILKSVKDHKKKEENEKHKEVNNLIDGFGLKAKAIVKDFIDQDLDWSVYDFEAKFLNNSKNKVNQNISDFLSKKINSLKSGGKIGNYKVKLVALSLWKKFDKNLHKTKFSDIDLDYLNKFNKFLIDRGLKSNSRWIVMANVRTFINWAVDENHLKESSSLFGRRGFNVSALMESTRKRFLPETYLNLIKKAEIKRKPLNYHRNVFMLIYYMQGISIRDLALLKKSNIVHLNDGDYFSFKREKLKEKSNTKHLQVKITPEIVDLRDKLCRYQKPIEDYYFPIITIPGRQGFKLYEHITARIYMINRGLKILAKQLGFEEINLTTYVARHTVANKLKQNKVPTEIIQQVFGHTNLATTQIYVDNFDIEEVNKAVSIL